MISDEVTYDYYTETVHDVLQHCAIGDWFIVSLELNRRGIYTTARRLGMKVRVNKQEDGYRVTRTK